MAVVASDESAYIVPWNCEALAAASVGVEHAITSCRTAEKRNTHIFAKNRCAQVKRRLQTCKTMVMHLELGIRILGASQCDLVIGPRVEVVKHHLVRSLLCAYPKISDIYRLRQAILWTLS